MTSLADRLPALAAPEEEPAAQPLDLQVVLTALRYWWKLAAPAAIVLATIAVVAVAYLSNPRYTASTWLVVREKPEYLVTPQAMEDPRKFVQNQMEMMRSPLVIEPVANKADVAATPELAGSDPAERLRRLIKIQAKGQSDFFVISFTSEDPRRAALVVNEVAAAYLSLQDRDLSRRMEGTIQRLASHLEGQQVLITKLRDQVQKRTTELTGVDPYASRSAAALATLNDTLGPLQAQIVAAEIDQSLTAAQVEAEEALIKNQALKITATDLEQHVQAHPDVVAVRRRLDQTLASLRDHERISANLERNAVYQQLLRQSSADKGQLEKRLGELRVSLKTDLEERAQLQRSDQVVSMRKSLEAKQLTVTILRDRWEQERKKQTEYKGETVELEFLRSDYESAARVFEAINSRIVAMRLEQHAPDRVMLFEDRIASAPTFPDEALPYKKMGMAGSAAFFLPFALAIGAELLFRRVSTRRQLESTSRMQVVAEVTSMPRILASRAASREFVSRELQLFEESIDGLRTHLLLCPAAASLRTIAVTSAISREGKTSVAIQLALSLARSSEGPTLLIDGDLRCPDIHRIFEVERSPGLAELLQDTCSQRAAIDTEYGPSLHLLSAGKLDALPHKLLSSAALPRLLEELKNHYRFIVIDTPPILPASEALMIARQADVTLVCARRDFSRLDQVAEAYARLQKSGARVAGAVLNGISPRTYAYRYGSYYYERPTDHGLAVVGPPSETLTDAHSPRQR